MSNANEGLLAGQDALEQGYAEGWESESKRRRLFATNGASQQEIGLCWPPPPSRATHTYATQKKSKGVSSPGWLASSRCPSHHVGSDLEGVCCLCVYIPALPAGILLSRQENFCACSRSRKPQKSRGQRGHRQAFQCFSLIDWRSREAVDWLS